MSELVKGTVKWFNVRKGWGFIAVPGEERDVFVHFRDLCMEGFKFVLAGDAVELVVESGERGPTAKQVRKV